MKRPYSGLEVTMAGASGSIWTGCHALLLLTPKFGLQEKSCLIVDTVVQGLVSRIFVFIYSEGVIMDERHILWDYGRIGHLDEMDGIIKDWMLTLAFAIL